MKTTNTLIKRTALMTVLILSSSAWLSAQDTNHYKIGVLGGGLNRQPEKLPSDMGTNSQSSTVMKINKGSALIGSTVKNQQGEELGKIRDLVLDFDSGRVAYLVLDSATTWLGAQKLHAVPVRAFQADPEGTFLVLNADKGKLERSEVFAKDNWPAVTTATWGAEPFWTDVKETPGTGDKLFQDSANTNWNTYGNTNVNTNWNLYGNTYGNTNWTTNGNRNTLIKPTTKQPQPQP